VTWGEVENTFVESAVNPNPVMAVAVTGLTPMFPVMADVGTVEMPLLARMTKFLAVPRFTGSVDAGSPASWKPASPLSLRLPSPELEPSPGPPPLEEEPPEEPLEELLEEEAPLSVMWPPSVAVPPPLPVLPQAIPKEARRNATPALDEVMRVIIPTVNARHEPRVQ
jgi:hypothetical protein